MFAMVAYAILLAAIGIVIVASLRAMREGIRMRGRLRGFIVTGGALVLALASLFLLLI